MTDLDQAMQLHLEGRYLESEALYRQIVKEHPDSAKTLHCLGFLLQQTGRLEESLDLIEQSLAIDDAHAEWHYNHGIVLDKLGRGVDASEAFSRSLKLNPSNYFCWTNLGAVLEKNGSSDLAEQAYREAAMRDPHCKDAYYLLASLLASQGRFDEARYFNCRGIIADPVERKSRTKLGLAHCEIGQKEEAICLMESWLEEEPGNPVPLHMIAAFRGLDAPERCPDRYIEATFDTFAKDFDSVLSRLNYSGPRLLEEEIARLDFREESLHVLDLGCGTGLSGPVLKPVSRTLTGVDLSGAMLDKAREKQCHDALIKAEICEFLDRESMEFDLVACIDTLIYFGDLEAVFSKVHARLKPGGSFIFTTEAGACGFALDITGRYRHARDYVAALLERAGFSMLHVRDAPIRLENARPVPGHLFSARKGR